MGHDLNYRRGRGGRPYERAKAYVYEHETHCARCHKPVDKTIPHRDPATGKVNKWSKSFGHVSELAGGSNPYDGHLEHWWCNVSAGGKYGRSKQGNDELRSSPDWE